MSVVKKMISLKEEDEEFLNVNSISLSQFVRNSIKNLKENGIQVSRPEPLSKTQFRSSK